MQAPLESNDWHLLQETRSKRFRQMWHEVMIKYTSECLVAIINTNNGIKEPTRRYQSCNTNRIMIFSGHVKVRESLSTQVIIWVNTILNHIDTRAVLPRYAGSRMKYRARWYWKQKYVNYSYPTGLKKCEILIIDTLNGIKNRQYQFITG